MGSRAAESGRAEGGRDAVAEDGAKAGKRQQAAPGKSRPDAFASPAPPCSRRLVRDLNLLYSSLSFLRSSSWLTLTLTDPRKRRMNREPVTGRRRRACCRAPSASSSRTVRREASSSDRPPLSCASLASLRSALSFLRFLSQPATTVSRIESALDMSAWNSAALRCAPDAAHAQPVRATEGAGAGTARHGAASALASGLPARERGKQASRARRRPQSRASPLGVLDRVIECALDPRCQRRHPLPAREAQRRARV